MNFIEGRRGKNNSFLNVWKINQDGESTKEKAGSFVISRLDSSFWAVTELWNPFEWEM